MGRPTIYATAPLRLLIDPELGRRGITKEAFCRAVLFIHPAKYTQWISGAITSDHDQLARVALHFGKRLRLVARAARLTREQWLNHHLTLARKLEHGPSLRAAYTQALNLVPDGRNPDAEWRGEGPMPDDWDAAEMGPPLEDSEGEDPCATF